MNGISISFVVRNKYITYGSGPSTAYGPIPMFDFGYTINYSFAETAGPAKSASGQEFPEYGIAKNLKLIKKYSFNWSGMTETEKLEFEAFIKSFNNSFQSFKMWVYDTISTYTNYYFIIESDNVIFKKDKFDLWSINLTLIQLESL